MKHEIIQTEDDYLIIVNDEKLNLMDWCYGGDINNGFKKNIHRATSADLASQQLDDKEHRSKKIITHLPLNPLSAFSYLDGVDLLPAIEDEIERLAKEWNNTQTALEFGKPHNAPGRLKSFISGYNKAKETYKYTEDDLRNLVNSVTEFLSHHEPSEFNEWFEKKLQSLNQPKLPIAFNVDIEVNCTGNNNEGCFMDSCGHNCGCVKQKTITNSKGQTEWVGKYEF